MRLALELADKSYDLSASFNARHMVIRLADGCSEGPRCNFTQFKALKTQRKLFEHPSTSCMVSRLALELAGKSYGLPTSSNANRMVIQLADGCSEASHCNFTQSKALKTQRELFEHTSANCLVSRLALELAGKSYGLPASSNASLMVIWLADVCSKGPRCNFTQSKALKTQRGPSEHPSTSHLVIRFVLELADKPYDLPTSFNASRMIIRLAHGCSEGSRCNFTQYKELKTQRKPFEHPSASRMVSRLALELAGKSYGLPASCNASRMVIRLADGCSKGPRCNFTQFKALKMQRGSFEHPSTSRLVMRLALELFDKSYDLPASSNANHITIRLADECLEGTSSVFCSGFEIEFVFKMQFRNVLNLLRLETEITGSRSVTGLVTAQSLVSGLLVSNPVSGFLDCYWLVSGFLDCDWLVSGYWQDWLLPSGRNCHLFQN
ncbi:hypothetical protein L7F22_050455 [Adiantum nelumboides]|nr:hypothetical protein [Adiantum nelumboides]